MTSSISLGRLAKVMALASSDNTDEALAGLRSARKMLTAAGLDFVDLAHALAEGEVISEELVELREVVADLRRQLRHERAERRRSARATGDDKGSPPQAADEVQGLRKRLENAQEQIELCAPDGFSGVIRKPWNTADMQRLIRAVAAGGAFPGN